MKSFLFLLKKELRQYLVSPMVYVIVVAFVLGGGYLFSANLFENELVTMRSFFLSAPIILLFIVPAFVMGIFADEKKQGTTEYLLTKPISEGAIVSAKYVAGLIFIFVLLFLTIVYPLSLSMLGSVDYGPIIGGYIGLFFLGAMWFSWGLFFSSITSNSLVAFTLTFSLSLANFLLMKYIDILSTFDNTSKGVLDLRDFIYYFSIIGFFLYLTHQTLLNRQR